jgi:hypothetical protein
MTITVHWPDLSQMQARWFPYYWNIEREGISR